MRFAAKIAFVVLLGGTGTLLNADSAIADVDTKAIKQCLTDLATKSEALADPLVKHYGWAKLWLGDEIMPPEEVKGKRKKLPPPRTYKKYMRTVVNLLSNYFDVRSNPHSELYHCLAKAIPELSVPEPPSCSSDNNLPADNLPDNTAHCK
ncbi:MAG: hypothetical protein ACHBN1_34595 [Heteroscytonema crispum UTEX LB 1556]